MVKKDYGFAFTKIINSKTRKPINKNIDLDLEIRSVHVQNQILGLEKDIETKKESIAARIHAAAPALGAPQFRHSIATTSTMTGELASSQLIRLKSGPFIRV